MPPICDASCCAVHVPFASVASHVLHGDETVAQLSYTITVPSGATAGLSSKASPKLSGVSRVVVRAIRSYATIADDPFDANPKSCHAIARSPICAACLFEPASGAIYTGEFAVDVSNV